MKSRENLLRLKHFQVQEKTRQLAQIDTMLDEFKRMSDDLTTQIDIEEKKAGISDVNHFAYPTFAKAARQRVDNIAVSIRDLDEKRQAAADALTEAEDDLRKAEMKDARDGGEADVDEASTSEVQDDRRAIIG